MIAITPTVQILFEMATIIILILVISSITYSATMKAARGAETLSKHAMHTASQSLQMQNDQIQKLEEQVDELSRRLDQATTLITELRSKISTLEWWVTVNNIPVPSSVEEAQQIMNTRIENKRLSNQQMFGDLQEESRRLRRDSRRSSRGGDSGSDLGREEDGGEREISS